MAMKINTGDSEYTRQDFFFVDPFEVIVKDELRGRRKPPSEEAIIEMAVSLYDHGQQQPVQCRKVENNRIMLNLGFTRTAACRLIRTGFKTTDEEGGERTIHDPEFKLKVTITDANDEVAFVNNVVENCHRNATSPIDDAFNQARLRDRYGYSDKKIMSLYRYKDENKVPRLRKLLALPARIQDMVHDGTMPVNAALDLLDLPAEKWDDAIKAATNDKGVVVAARVTEQVRSHILSDDERLETGGMDGQGSANSNGQGSGGSRTPTTRHKALTMSDYRKFVQEELVALKDAEKDDPLKVYYETLMLFLQGKRSKKKMHEAAVAMVKA